MSCTSTLLTRLSTPKIESPTAAANRGGLRGLGPWKSTAVHGEGPQAAERANPAGLGHGADAENLVDLVWSQRVIAGGHGAEDFRVEFDLVECHAVVDTQIETLAHRAHLRR